MTIRNNEKLTEFLVDWIQDQAKRSGTKGATVGVSGGVDSAVVLALCTRAFGKSNVRAVLMPCHSSKASTDRGMELVNAFEVPYLVVNLEKAFETIVAQAGSPAPSAMNFAQGALRSCLRAPTLDYVAKMHNHLIYGTGNRDEDAIFRYFQKRGDGAVDNNPIVGLHKSEVYALATYLGVPASIIAAKPTADLWGAESGQEDEKELGITYAEIEWVTRENDRFFGVLDPHESRSSLEKARHDPYSERQWYVIEAARKADAATAHKAALPPGADRFSLVAEDLVV